MDRGRYGFANYLKSCGPEFVRQMPRGYVVELVQLLLNKNFLQFRKGKVSFRCVCVLHGPATCFPCSVRDGALPAGRRLLVAGVAPSRPF